MGLLRDLFFGLSEPVNPGKKKPAGGCSSFGNGYDDYYGDLHDEAMSGDIDAQEEMREEFGDNWEAEY